MPPTTHETTDGQRRDCPAISRAGRGKRAPGSSDAVTAFVVQQVLPRLAGRDAPEPPVSRPRHAVQVQAYVEALLGQDIDAALTGVAALRRRGMPDSQICLGLLAPAARGLIEMWNDDACDYGSFTLGLWRLRMVLNQLDGAPAAARDAVRHAADPAA